MEQLKNLTNGQKARLISFTLIVLYLLYGVLAYAWEVRMQTPRIDYVDSMQIDGSEFASIANLFVGGANSLIAGVTMVLSVAAMFVIALFLMVLWRCIALRKSSVVAETEWKVAKYLMIGYAVCAVCSGWCVLRFTGLLYIILLTGAPLLFIWLLGVWPLRNAHLKQRVREDD